VVDPSQVRGRELLIDQFPSKEVRNWTDGKASDELANDITGRGLPQEFKEFSKDVRITSKTDETKPDEKLRANENVSLSKNEPLNDGSDGGLLDMLENIDDVDENFSHELFAPMNSTKQILEQRTLFFEPQSNLTKSNLLSLGKAASAASINSSNSNTVPVGVTLSTCADNKVMDGYHDFGPLPPSLPDLKKTLSPVDKQSDKFPSSASMNELNKVQIKDPSFPLRDETAVERADPSGSSQSNHQPTLNQPTKNVQNLTVSTSLPPLSASPVPVPTAERIPSDSPPSDVLSLLSELEAEEQRGEVTEEDRNHRRTHSNQAKKDIFSGKRLGEDRFTDPRRGEKEIGDPTGLLQHKPTGHVKHPSSTGGPPSVDRTLSSSQSRESLPSLTSTSTATSSHVVVKKGTTARTRKRNLV